MGLISTAVIIIVVMAAFGIYSTKKSFRRMLPRELATWLEEGLIGEEQAKRIREKYQLANIQAESQAILINAIFIFGAVLIACGVIAFVAAHWDGIPHFWKLAMIIGVMIAVYLTGFYLWKIKANLPRLGHALVLLGSLIFGANIALIAQMFHLTANFYDGFLIWAIGTLVMAYLTGSIPLADLAMISSFIWFIGWKTDNLSGIPVYPWLVLLFFLPFVYKHYSRSLHFLTILGWGAALAVSMVSGENSSILLVVATTVLVALIYWSYADWPLVSRNEDFYYDSKFLGVLLFGVLSYLLSFHGLVESLLGLNWDFRPGWKLLMGILTLILVVFSVAYGYRQLKAKNKLITYQMLIVVAAIIFALTFFGWLFGLIAGTILSNLAVILVGAFLFWFGLNELDRRYFWLGLGLLVLEIVSRFFEYETGLLWKSLAFILAGLILIGGGLGFEKRYRRRGTENE